MSAHNLTKQLAEASYEDPDPGTGAVIHVENWSQIPLVIGSGAETNTLPSPLKAGERVSFIVKTAGGGTRTITAAASINQTGNTTMAFTESGDMIVLESFAIGSAYQWRVIVNDGVTLG